MGPVRPLHGVAVHLLGAGPALGRAEDDHGPAGVSVDQDVHVLAEALAVDGDLLSIHGYLPPVFPYLAVAFMVDSLMYGINV